MLGKTSECSSGRYHIGNEQHIGILNLFWCRLTCFWSHLYKDTSGRDAVRRFRLHALLGRLNWFLTNKTYTEMGDGNERGCRQRQISPSGAAGRNIVYRLFLADFHTVELKDFDRRRITIESHCALSNNSTSLMIICLKHILDSVEGRPTEK